MSTLPEIGQPLCPWPTHRYRAAAHLLAGLEQPWPARAIEDLRRCTQHPVGVRHQQAAVPAEEEVAILAGPAAALAHKESRLPAAAVVGACVVRPAVAPAHGQSHAISSCTLQPRRMQQEATGLRLPGNTQR
jgi:hypothetical protein